MGRRLTAPRASDGSDVGFGRTVVLCALTPLFAVPAMVLVDAAGAPTGFAAVAWVALGFVFAWLVVRLQHGDKPDYVLGFAWWAVGSVFTVIAFFVILIATA